MAMDIRGYEGADLASCRSLWVSLTEWHRQIYKAAHIGGDDPGAQFDEHLDTVGAENLWVAESAGRLIGLIGLIPSSDEAEVEPVIVQPSDRHTGVGKALMQYVLAEARRRGLRRLIVRPVARNSAALTFFKAAGFTTVGHVELMADLDTAATGWRPGAEISGVEFDV